MPAATLTYTALSSVADLPGHDATYSAHTRGGEIAQFFKTHPQVPGIILAKGTTRWAALSQTQFLRVLSRPFGVELFYGRPIEAVVEAAEGAMLTLPTGTSISAAVERCLQRPPAEMYEPFLVEDEDDGNARIVDFRTLLQASGQLMALRNEQMDRILSTVTEGLITVEADGTIGPEYSRAVESMFERRELAGVPLMAVLASCLPEKQVQEAREYLEVLFNPRMIDRLIESVNPLREVKAIFLAEGAVPKEKHFSIRFRRIKTEGRIWQVLMRVEDVTRQHVLAQELAEQNARAEEQLQTVLQVMHADPEELGTFLRTFETRVLEAAELVQQNIQGLTAGERLKRIYRFIHGLKGEAGVLRLSAFQRELHRYEDAVEEEKRQRWNGDTSTEALRGLVPGLAELMRMAQETREAIGRFQRLGAALQIPAEGAAPTAPAVIDPLRAVQATISEVAERVQKAVAFHSRVELEEIPTAYRALLRETFIQLARNSLVHGIEPSAERIAAGKPAVGHLQLALRRYEQEGLLELVFQDDGRGLDPARLRARLEPAYAESCSDDEVLELIFASGFSTAESTTMDAGRGVGLDLVRQNLEAVGGRIAVHSQPGQYCAFRILLPAHTPALQTV